MNLALVLIKLHSVILFKAISLVVNTTSTCQPLPNKGLVVPAVLSASWYHCCRHTAWARFCSKLSSLAVPLSYACSPSSSPKIMVSQPGSQPSQESDMASGPVCAHTPKHGWPRRAAYLEGLRTHHQGLTVPHTSGEVSLKMMEMLWLWVIPACLPKS